MAETAAASPQPVNRREFMYYAWTASMLVFMGGSAAALGFYLFPRFREGEFGGKFPIAASSLPPVGAPPEENAAGRFWLVNTNSGLLALYKVCTHLGCLYKWVPNNTRFECPCHGSKFEATGEYIEGPAPRALDRFKVEVLDADGNIIAETLEGDMNAEPGAGQPVEIPDGAATIAVDTGARIDGPLI